MFSVVIVPSGVGANDTTADFPFPKKEKVDSDDAPAAKVHPPNDVTMLVFLPVVCFEDEIEFERIRAISRTRTLHSYELLYSSK